MNRVKKTSTEVNNTSCRYSNSRGSRPPRPFSTEPLSIKSDTSDSSASWSSSTNLDALAMGTGAVVVPVLAVAIVAALRFATSDRLPSTSGGRLGNGGGGGRLHTKDMSQKGQQGTRKKLVKGICKKRAYKCFGLNSSGEGRRGN